MSMEVDVCGFNLTQSGSCLFSAAFIFKRVLIILVRLSPCFTFNFYGRRSNAEIYIGQKSRNSDGV